MEHAAARTAAESALLITPYLWLIPALPLVGSLFNLALGDRLGKTAVRWVAPGVVLLSFLTGLYAFSSLLRAPHGAVLVNRLYPWIHAGSLQIDVSFSLDPLSGLMVLIVTGVGFLIHVYSTAYMEHDEGYARYFTYLNLFTFAMLVLVLADNLPLLFVGWEGVGLCSYLLIGFWYQNHDNASAGKKAFIVNRIGDAGFLLGMFLLFWSLGEGPQDLSFRGIAAQALELGPPASLVTAICLLLFVGAIGKSAQIPLYVWLPDAMAGPTPVSALIHAATMVTAGVYMVARMNFLYVLSPEARMCVAVVGVTTAVFAATIGLVQNDIKKVLAYSTVSQLGYMFLGLGVGAFGAAIFHVMTHAFFKALLFLGSGSVIHGMGGEQDIRKMGGLRKYMPTTYRTFLIGTIAIAGIPPFAGFFSKDEILFRVYTSGFGSLWAAGLIGAFFTAFYMARLLIRTFWGECRADRETQHHIHESPPAMTVPLVVLSVLSVCGGWLGLPMHLLWGNVLGEFLHPVFPHIEHDSHPVALELALMGASVGVAVAGMALAYVMYVLRPGLADRLAEQLPFLYRPLLNKYGIDELYDAVIVNPLVAASRWLWRGLDVAAIDGAVNGIAAVVERNGAAWRRLQSGNVQHYALSLFVGAVAILAYYVFA